jgi:flavin reductase (DIM6/NTAB) family NADH-FMN oxidoreductase RutF
VDAEDLSATVDRLAGDLDYPMCIVTTVAGRERSGCLVGFASQCSIDPQRFTVWLSKANHTFDVAGDARFLAVHFPSRAQADLAALFGGETGDEIDKFDRCRWHLGPDGLPILDDVARWFAGRILERYDTGDHVGHLLEPVAAACGSWAGQLGFQAASVIDPGHDA